MTKDVTIIVLGVLVALLPFSGFPGLWKTILFVILGLGIATLAFFMRKELIDYNGAGEKKTEVYVENGVNHTSNTQRTAPPHSSRTVDIKRSGD